MASLVIPLIIAGGSIAGLILWILKRTYGTKANQRKIIKLQEKVDAITKQMRNIYYGPRFSFNRYNKLNAERLQLNRRISRLKKLPRSK